MLWNYIDLDTLAGLGQVVGQRANCWESWGSSLYAIKGFASYWRVFNKDYALVSHDVFFCTCYNFAMELQLATVIVELANQDQILVWAFYIFITHIILRKTLANLYLHSQWVKKDIWALQYNKKIHWSFIIRQYYIIPCWCSTMKHVTLFTVC